METFISENFLLHTNTARKLYFDYVSHLPIIDYHNHLSPSAVAEDQKFQTITDAWLNGDHYKWRAMRANGIPENLITGNGDDFSKFRAWAETVPSTLRNPLYHWAHLELKHPFGINELLDRETADTIYHRCNSLLQTKYSVQEILKYHKVELLCTTNEPAEDLQYHLLFAHSDTALKMLPTFRPDALLNFNDRTEWLHQLQWLQQATNISIEKPVDFILALQNRVEYFHNAGCRLSDHGMEFMPPFSPGRKPEMVFNDILLDKPVLENDIQNLRAYILLELCRLYHSKNWVQQFHLGALRNNSSRLLKLVGKDAGTDSIGDFSQAKNLAAFLNVLDKEDKLAKTILYNLNPADNEIFATMAGNFNDGTIAGKIQWGPAWWFLDQKDGIEKQLNTLSTMGLLSHFVGMVTDSRSFLSFSRHDYFRRILCNVTGDDIEKGELPNDLNYIGKMLSGIAYYNAKNYFNWE